MSTTIITKKEVTVPVAVMAQVANVIIENEITHEIVGSDVDDDTITLELQYTKDEREIIHEIEDIISDYEEESEEEDQYDGEEK